MAAKTDIPTRVGVLEHGVQELKEGLTSHRNESREGFTRIGSMLDKLTGDIAKRAHPTNWFAVIGSVASTVAIVGAVFGLAEWRVSTATAPSIEDRAHMRRMIEKAQETVNDLKIQLSVEKAIREKVYTPASGRREGTPQ